MYACFRLVSWWLRKTFDHGIPVKNLVECPKLGRTFGSFFVSQKDIIGMLFIRKTVLLSVDYHTHGDFKWRRSLLSVSACCPWILLELHAANIYHHQKSQKTRCTHHWSAPSFRKILSPWIITTTSGSKKGMNCALCRIASRFLF